MSQQSSMNYYLNWAKERIDEMNAALASFEVKAGEAKAESMVKAEQIAADLKKRRDEFQALMKTQAEAGEALGRVPRPIWRSTGTASKGR